MITVKFTPPDNKPPIYGLLIGREGTICFIAFDEMPDRPMSIGYSRLNEQFSLSSEHVQWKHPAMKLIESGNLSSAVAIWRKEELARSEERQRKEKKL